MGTPAAASSQQIPLLGQTAAHSQLERVPVKGTLQGTCKEVEGTEAEAERGGGVGGGWWGLEGGEGGGKASRG